MKKSLALMGIALAGMLFSACSSSSSSSSEASLAEKCANGVSEECLEGATWNMYGLYYPNADGSYTLLHGFSNPSQLVFNSSKKEGKTFSLTYSLDPSIEGVGGLEDSGEWSVENGTLRLEFGRVGSLHTDTTKVISATIVSLDSAVALNLGGKVLHTTISEAGVEIFKGVEK